MAGDFVFIPFLCLLCMECVLFLCILEQCTTTPTLEKQRNSILSIKKVGKSSTEGIKVRRRQEGVSRVPYTIHQRWNGVDGVGTLADNYV